MTTALYERISSRIGELNPIESITITDETPFNFDLLPVSYRRIFIRITPLSWFSVCKAMIRIAIIESFGTVEYAGTDYATGWIHGEKFVIRWTC